MAVFVAALFLPHTIDFHVPEQNPPLSAESRQPSQVRVGNYGKPEGGGLFTPEQSPPTTGSPEGTISQETEQNFRLDEESFGSPEPSSSPPEASSGSPGASLGSPEAPSGSSKAPSHSSKAPSFASSKSLGAIAHNEPHSPAWGRTTYFNQPKSRAESPPPVSILQHLRVTDSPLHSRNNSLIESSEQEGDDLESAEWSVQATEQGNGGLRNAINAAICTGFLQERTWVGTLGMPTDAITEDRKNKIADKLDNEYDCLTIFPKDSDFNGCYSHFCKTILWPVFHYQIPDNPKSKAYEDHSWVYYVKINQLFADRIVKSYKRGDIIWIHDYHLLLVPSMIRSKLPDAEIGFFLHVAFPSSEVFRCLATRKELLEGMLGANLIGFQTQEYCLHFLQTCNRILFVESTGNGVQLEDRFIDVATFPIGIDPVALDHRRNTADVRKWLQKLENKYAGKYLVVARDKLDHIRGVQEKLLSYEQLLGRYPEFREKVVMIQVATSTTEQAQLESMVSDTVTRINSAYSSLAHQPLVFLKQDMEYSQYLALIMAADVFMITSLREGMNLTSHEFLFCQDGKFTQKKHGSLILSEFTGSASFFQENQLSVNPWDYRQCSEAIRKGLSMSAEEKKQRWTKLMDSVTHNTGEFWVRSFLTHLNQAWDQHFRQHTASIPRLSLTDVVEKYKAAGRRLFMIDYEGTIVPNGHPASSRFVTQQRSINTIRALVEDPCNMVYVTSAFTPDVLDSDFNRVPGVGLIAENGCLIKEIGEESWFGAADMTKMAACKRSIAKTLDYYRERIEGSRIEERYCSIILHTGGAKDPAAATRQAGECANHIDDACQNMGMQAVPCDGGLLIEPTEWSKGTAATRVFERLVENAAGPPDFLMVVGDGREDEVAYRWANKLGEDKVVREVVTVSVSSRNTEAQATITQGVTGVLSTLQKLTAK